MKTDLNILHLTPDFNYSDGRSYYVYLLLKYFKRNGSNVYLCTNGGDSFERLKDIDVKIFADNKLSDKKSFLKSAVFLSGIVREYKIDIIHSHHRYYELLSNTVRKNNKIKTVHTALSIVDKRYFAEYKSDSIIAVSNCVREMLEKKFKVNTNKIILIPNFTDTEEITENNSKVNSDDKYEDRVTNIFSAGRFHKEKNYSLLLKGFSLINKKYKIKLTLIGEGEEKSLLESIAADKNINLRILPPEKDLSKHFKSADICVLTSIRDPLPGFMLQSGLHGKPFIGSDTDGIPEVIQDGKNGLLFANNNYNQLAEKLTSFTEDTAFANGCASELNKLVLSKFTERSVIPDIEKVYINLISSL